MKRKILILCMLGFVLSGAYAQSTGGGGNQEKPVTINQDGTNVNQTLAVSSDLVDSRKRISVDLRDVPLKDAIDMVFKTAGRAYTLSPAINGPSYENMRVSMKFENVTVDDAIAGLLTSNNLMAGIQDNTIIIIPLIESKSSPTNASASQPRASSSPIVRTDGSGFGGSGGGFGGGYTSGSAGGLGGGLKGGMLDMIPDMPPFNPANELVTISIPSMPVKDAIAMIEPGWTFNSNLGNTIMPGARFSGFQMDMAIALVLSAAGLAPPAKNDKVVTSKGKADLSMYQWTPAAMSGQQSGIIGYIPTQQAIAIGMCKVSGKSLFTILAVRAPERDLLEKLMSNSGCSYFLGDTTFKADASWHTLADVKDKGVKQMWRGFTYRPESRVSTQLYNVTLDEALNSILPMLGGVKFCKQGPAANPTYYIESQFPGTGSSDVMPLKDKNEKVIGKMK
ncbi:MAG: STN domain-containing protein [Armatimonadota bacterium]